MKKAILFLTGLLLLTGPAFSQFVSEGRPVIGSTSMPAPSKVTNRNAQNPKSCKSDTTTYPRFYTTAYYTVSIRSGSSLGQYFPAPQSITVSGFYFYAFSLTATPARPVYVRLRCNVYKAGADSLPTGSPLASDTITVDTVMGSSIPLSRIMRKAVFKTPATFNGGGYVIAVECDSSSVGAGIITNNWNAGDGKKQNIGCGSVSGKWYRCLQLNIGGVRFDANMQYYPFVKYNFGTDFTIDNNCYATNDTVRFTNTNKSNVSGSIFYNYYIYYNLEQYSHRWTYDNFSSQYMVNGKYKPPVKKNFKTQLISTVYSYSSGQCYDTAEKMVYFKPTFPTTKKAPRGCRGDTVTIDLATDAGVTIKWYKNAWDTVPFNTGYSYTIKNAQKNDTFYVRAFNGPCSSNLNKIEFSINEYPNKPIVKNDSLCSGAIANLSAKSNLGTIEWYNNITGGLPVWMGNNLQTSKLSKDTEFYVQSNNFGCVNKGGRVLVKAFVGSSFAPEKPITVSDTFTCLHPTKQFKLFASQKANDTLRWFDQPTGGKLLGKGDSFVFTPSKRGDALYYVETWNGICGSGRSETKVRVYDYPTIYGLTGDTICKGEAAYPYLSVPWGNVNWYADKKSSTPVYSGKAPTFGGLTSDVYLYLKAEENGCVNSGWDSVKIFVNAPPVPTSVKSDAVCARGIGTFQVNIPSGKVNWYYDAADPDPFYTGSTVGTGMMLSNITWYYETENKGCKSAKTPVTINIKPRPTAGFTWSLQWQNKLVCVPITTSGLTIAWDWGDGKTSAGAPYTHQYASSGNYMVRMVATSTTNGCKDTADIPVIINHTAVKNIHTEDIQVYPIPVSSNGILNFTGADFNNASAEIYSMDGRVIANGTVLGSGMQMPANIPAGIYWIKISKAGKYWSASIVVSE